MKSFVFTYSRLDITAASISQLTKVIATKDALTAQVQMLLFLNKNNKEGNGKMQYWCDTLHPTQTLGLCES